MKKREQALIWIWCITLVCVLNPGAVRSESEKQTENARMTRYIEQESGASFLIPGRYEKQQKEDKIIFVSPRNGGYITFQTSMGSNGKETTGSARSVIQSLSKVMKRKYGATIHAIGKTQVGDRKGWGLRSQWLLKKKKRRMKVAQDETAVKCDDQVFKFGLVTPPECYKQNRMVYELMLDSFRLQANDREKQSDDNEANGPLRLDENLEVGSKKGHYSAYVDDAGRLHLLDREKDVMFIVEPISDRSRVEDGTGTEQEDNRGAQEREQRRGSVIGSTTRMDKGVVVREQKRGDEKPIVTAKVSGKDDRVEHRGYRGPLLNWDGAFGAGISDLVLSDILVDEGERVIDLGAAGRGLSVYEKEDGNLIRVRLKGVGPLLNLRESRRRIVRGVDEKGGRVFYTFRTEGYKVTVGMRKETDD